MSATNEKEWTVMFYFACDNALAPDVVTQLKALKQAGFHPDVNVVAQFDPQTVQTPTHIFEVNLINKLKNHGKPNIGFGGNDPYVRTLMEDKLWRDQKSRDGVHLIRDLLRESLARKGYSYNPPIPPPDKKPTGGAVPSVPTTAKRNNPKELNPKEALTAFLKFCSEAYPARHYMLFLLGHGLVVGNDVFLFDEHVDGDQHSLSLVDLGAVLKYFKQEIKKQNSQAEFELVSFHSCSVSGLEVAYELQDEVSGNLLQDEVEVSGNLAGVANYMLASQGPAFVGSWPYREILIRVLNDVNELEGGTVINVKEMVVKIFYYILHNSADFLLAGYSFQLTLCDLNKVSAVTSPLQELAKELVKGLKNPLTRDFVLRSHWQSISFWQESYTDLYDFCFCLRNRCEEYACNSGGMHGLVDTIYTACGRVMDQLVNGVPGNDDRLIVRSEFAGPTYQYSHGLSVFFSWARPLDKFMDIYNTGYKFKVTSWHEFLEEYFKETKRHPRQSEPDSKAPIMLPPTDDDKLEEDIVSICFNNEGTLRAANTLDDPPPVKTHPNSPLGDGCTCPSIKNYPHDTRPRRERGKQADKQPLPASPDAFNVL